MFTTEQKKTIIYTLVVSIMASLFFSAIVVIKFIPRGEQGFAPSSGYSVTIASPLTVSTTTIAVSSVVDDDSVTLALSASNKGYFTIDPGQTDVERIVCTGVDTNTTSLTGCTRGLASSGSSETGSASRASTHDVGSRIIMTNTAQFFSNYMNLWDDQTATGTKTFISLPKVPQTTPTDDAEVASWGIITAVALQGAATSTESIAGICELSTRLEMASSTDKGFNSPLCNQAKYASDNTRGFDEMVSQVTGGSDQAATSSATILAQTFKTTATTTRITRISLSLKRVLSPAALIFVKIFEVDGNNKPTGSSLGTIGTNATSNFTTSYITYDFDTNNINVSPNTTYAVQWSGSILGSGNYLDSEYSNTNIYSDGNYLISYDTGSTWTASTTADFVFKVYSNIPSSDNTIIISDSDGKLDMSWFDFSENYDFLANISILGNLEVTGSAIFSGKFEANRTMTAIIDDAIDGSGTPKIVAFHTNTDFVVIADANNASSTRAFGFITTNAIASSSPNITVSGVLSGFTGLTINAEYYLSDAAGTISTTQGTRIIPIGSAISSTEILLNWGVKKYIVALSVSGQSDSASQGDVATSTRYIGFEPSSVRFKINGLMQGTNSSNSFWDIICNGKSTTCYYTGVTYYNNTSAENRQEVFSTGSAFAGANPGGTNSGHHTLNITTVDDEKIVFTDVYTTKNNTGVTSSWTVYAEITGY